MPKQKLIKRSLIDKLQTRNKIIYIPQIWNFRQYIPQIWNFRQKCFKGCFLLSSSLDRVSFMYISLRQHQKFALKRWGRGEWLVPQLICNTIYKTPPLSSTLGIMTYRALVPKSYWTLVPRASETLRTNEQCHLGHKRNFGTLGMQNTGSYRAYRTLVPRASETLLNNEGTTVPLA